MHPLTAIEQILQHVTPKYFQKSRHYGLHSAITYPTVEHKIPEKIKRNNNTVRTILEITKEMLGISSINTCPYCQAENSLIIDYLAPDKQWIKPYLSNNRAPPTKKSFVKCNTKNKNLTNNRKGKYCPKSKKSSGNACTNIKNPTTLQEIV